MDNNLWRHKIDCFDSSMIDVYMVIHVKTKQICKISIKKYAYFANNT